MDKFSYLSNADVSWFESQFQKFQKDPESVEESWRKFFEGFEFARANYDVSAEGANCENVHKEFRVINLINGYRSRGHLFTRTNPVRERRKYSPTLDITNFGLDTSDLSTVFQAGEEIGIGPATLQNIIDHLDETYCRSIGIEYNYIRDPERMGWIRDSIEIHNRPKFSADTKLEIFNKLNQATVFEQYLQKKFVGQKRFSVEGGEALIPAIDRIIEHGSTLGVKEFVMGMAHRGRLNVLTNIFGKPAQEIFSEFEGKAFEDNGKRVDGDVKYHLGYSCNVNTLNGNKVHLTLAPNPSHLEAVDPVVEGITRAKIDNYLEDNSLIVPILVHGDAAIAAQGIMYELVQMAQLDGYATGGTIHLVVNNQVGFTTNYLDGRSSTYCTDVAKVTLCPVFHVNGDDVEAVIQTVQIALEYRQRFKRDVFVDLLCYRKYGHNEGDEPKFTQPKLYDLIAVHPNPREIYGKQLLNEGILTPEKDEQLRNDVEHALDKSLDAAKKIAKASVMKFLENTWKDLRMATPADFLQSPDTGFDAKKLRELAISANTLPKDKKFFRKVVKLMDDRLQMVESDKLDWAMGELLAYATLLSENKNVRVSGQDVERGTFSHRHAVIKTEDTEEEYVPLNHISKKQGDFYIYNSLLSEYAVLGFDYGYAFGSPHALTIWEAQFGDFNNGAQIIIDQFISAGEEKWRTMNGLVMLLPHGYEGMGSEHSSARLERFLTLCAEDNIQVCNISTPANFFHALRRQIYWPFRKPLIVMSPKKLLRHPQATSKLSEMAKGRFQEIIDDVEVKVENVDTVVFCSGKIYYEIMEEREKQQAGYNMAFVRMEQFFPLPDKQVRAVVAKYKNAKKLIWMQEEPENMGAWAFVSRKYKDLNFEYIGREESASPAGGSPIIHNYRQNLIIEALFKNAKTLKQNKKSPVA
jgi:2-oxoglutarate dehydrogenase E1 component